MIDIDYNDPKPGSRYRVLNTASAADAEPVLRSDRSALFHIVTQEALFSVSHDIRQLLRSDRWIEEWIWALRDVIDSHFIRIERHRYTQHPQLSDTRRRLHGLQLRYNDAKRLRAHLHHRQYTQTRTYLAHVDIARTSRSWLAHLYREERRDLMGKLLAQRGIDDTRPRPESNADAIIQAVNSGLIEDPLTTRVGDLWNSDEAEFDDAVLDDVNNPDNPNRELLHPIFAVRRVDTTERLIRRYRDDPTTLADVALGELSPDHLCDRQPDEVERILKRRRFYAGLLRYHDQCKAHLRNVNYRLDYLRSQEDHERIEADDTVMRTIADNHKEQYLYIHASLIPHSEHGVFPSVYGNSFMRSEIRTRILHEARKIPLGIPPNRNPIGRHDPLVFPLNPNRGLSRVGRIPPDEVHRQRYAFSSSAELSSLILGEPTRFLSIVWQDANGRLPEESGAVLRSPAWFESWFDALVLSVHYLQVAIERQTYLGQDASHKEQQLRAVRVRHHEATELFAQRHAPLPPDRLAQDTGDPEKLALAWLAGALRDDWFEIRNEHLNSIGLPPKVADPPKDDFRRIIEGIDQRLLVVSNDKAAREAMELDNLDFARRVRQDYRDTRPRDMILRHPYVLERWQDTLDEERHAFLPRARISFSAYQGRTLGPLTADLSTMSRSEALAVLNNRTTYGLITQRLEESRRFLVRYQYAINLVTRAYTTTRHQANDEAYQKLKNARLAEYVFVRLKLQPWVGPDGKLLPIPDHEFRSLKANATTALTSGAWQG